MEVQARWPWGNRDTGRGPGPCLDPETPTNISRPNSDRLFPCILVSSQQSLGVASTRDTERRTTEVQCHTLGALSSSVVFSTLKSAEVLWAKLKGLLQRNGLLGPAQCSVGFKGENPPADWTSPVTCGLSQGIGSQLQKHDLLPALQEELGRREVPHTYAEIPRRTLHLNNCHLPWVIPQRGTAQEGTRAGPLRCLGHSLSAGILSGC